MQFIDCNDEVVVTVKIGDREYGLREFTMDDQEFLEGLQDENSTDGLREVLVRCGIPKTQVGKIPLRKVKAIADALSGVMNAEKK